VTARGPRAWVELDLEAVQHNASTAREVAGVPLLAVVKADGYGHGAADVARAALCGGAERLAVATPSEALRLRQAGIAAPIQVLGSLLPEELEDAVASRASVTLHELEDVARFRGAARQAGRPLDVHVKVNVGMHRHGVHPDQALTALAAVEDSPELRLEGLMTHLPCAASEELVSSRRQVRRFAQVAAQAARAALLPDRIHAAASAALFRLPESRFNQVRSGIALLGLDPLGRIGTERLGLRPALSLHARVMRLQRVAEGHTAGYGARWRARRASTLAIVGIGYGDGLPYTLTGRGGEVLVGGRRCPLVGTVMMDYVLVDVTDLPCPPCPGEQVTVIGRQGATRIALEEQAEKAGLIPYALACGLGDRLQRRVGQVAQPRLMTRAA
jgi:alanine racemase